MKINIPFYLSPDETHCFQACLKTVLKYFEPDKDYSWKQLDKISAKKKDKWTWPTASIINLVKKKYDILVLEDWNYQAFVDRGEKYLIRKYGAEAATEQIENSDIAHERRLMKEFIKTDFFECRIPTISDIKTLMKRGYLVICNLNSRTLENQTGYKGHFIVVTGFSRQNLFLHDPYSPQYHHRIVSSKFFNTAWAYPTDDVKNIIAIKKK